MPTLHWVGKDKVVRHHHDVPFKVLQREYRFESASPSANTSDGNKIIHGDNLEALKALLPEYEGRVKCIYIDPPYNTGNEGWVYNDNVNDPRIVKWLNKVVGKEGEDLSRHDKWLCMMYPRLKLLHRLLAEDGSIWVSIDDIEAANLRLMMDEIFGSSHFVADVLWQKKYAVANDHKTIAPMHDHILVYRKTEQWQRGLLPRTEEKDRQYRFQDEKGIFRISDYTCNKSADERPNLYYPIVNPNTNDEIWPKKSRVWSYSQAEHQRHVAENLIYWGKDGQGKTPSFKRYKHLLKTGDGTVPQTWWTHEFAGHTDTAKKEIRAILADHPAASDFITPKPASLIERILQIASPLGNPSSGAEDGVILDSFAGSGTTAHAVLKLNAQDGGNRKFILVEMMDYAETITAERVRRVMEGYGEAPSPQTSPAGRGSKAVEGLGGGFEYFTLGEALFDEQGQLNEAAGVEAILRYVAYSERIPSPVGAGHARDESGRYYLGEAHGVHVYFIYQPDRVTSLDLDLLARLPIKPGKQVIYADQCLLGEDFMRRHTIVFKKIPRDISRF